MHCHYQDFIIRDWQPRDRQMAADLIFAVLSEYGLECEADDADSDVLNVESAYWETGGQFWVVEYAGQLVGTAGFYPVSRRPHSVEIRKMYLHPNVRGKGLGRWLLNALEDAIAHAGHHFIWIETASVLKEAVRLYESNGYQPSTGVETARCDLVYVKPVNSVAQPGAGSPSSAIGDA